MQNSKTKKPIEIKISTVVAVSVILHIAELPVLAAALDEMTGGAPDFFDDEIAVIDVGALDPAAAALDWAALTDLLKSHHLNPMAVRNAPAELHSDIKAHGMSIDAVTTPRAGAVASAPAIEMMAEPAKPEAPVAPTAAMAAMIVDTPVRAGQRIYARGADLIITAVVNNGAEVIADGSIHIYAPLRGRALAGASGNPDARIFAMVMEPELVSIAGIYRTFENGFPQDLGQHPAQVRLVGDKIEIVALNPASRS
ncbi:septum site-determining protein MinC [Herminiimonas sp. CN]|uniref:septum site-determining protein MinC n=1 Tax=Herminiimonas sp. CN TaxID=1349818 RepID=UPI000473806D|nr:septum site-determining protein MinC [Herminiimonas sp. CN]